MRHGRGNGSRSMARSNAAASSGTGKSESVRVEFCPIDQGAMSRIAKLLGDYDITGND